MTQFKRLFRRRFNLLLGLLSLFLVISFSACSQPEATTSSSSADTSAEGAMPTEFRIGYQVIPNAEVLTKNLGIMEEKFPDV